MADFGAAGRTLQRLRRMKIGVIGKLAGMGDVITDDMAVYRKLGPEFVYDSVGTLQRLCAAITPGEVERRVAYERTVFDIDPALPPERHAEAVRMYLGFKRYLQENGYAGYTAHFEEFGADGRFTQLPLLSASSLMADGYGYAAEGDATTAMLMAAMHTLCGEANFSEMYMMDLAREAILLCHAGEGNWATARTDRKPFLMDRAFGEGGLSNPPTPIFTPRPGRAGVMSLVHLSGERFRLVYAAGQMLDKVRSAPLRHALYVLPARQRGAPLRDRLAGAGRHPPRNHCIGRAHGAHPAVVPPCRRRVRRGLTPKEKGANKP